MTVAEGPAPPPLLRVFFGGCFAIVSFSFLEVDRCKPVIHIAVYLGGRAQIQHEGLVAVYLEMRHFKASVGVERELGQRREAGQFEQHNPARAGALPEREGLRRHVPQHDFVDDLSSGDDGNKNVVAYGADRKRDMQKRLSFLRGRGCGELERRSGRPRCRVVFEASGHDGQTYGAREFAAPVAQRLRIGREALRRLMIDAGLWRVRRQKVEAVHQWRQRRSCRGELVQWDTSEHQWLEGRGEKLYLIHMIDDATSELTARFVRSDSTEQNMRLLWTYIEKHGRPLGFYTDKASLFRTAPKTPRDRTELAGEEREPLPPTQIGRALAELGIVWIAAHSPQAKGRVERSFGTAQDRLVKGLRVAGARTLEDANRYLDEEFLPWWNQHLVVASARAADAHRPLDAGHHLPAALSQVDIRQVASDYTIRVAGKIYQIAREQICSGLRHAMVRVESRLDGTVAIRFGSQYLKASLCQPAAKPTKTLETLLSSPARRIGKRLPSEAARAANDQLFKNREYRAGPQARSIAPALATGSTKLSS